MSLNRREQILYDYIFAHPDERHYWQDKVRAIVAGSPDVPKAATQLEAELRRYHVERSSVVPEIGAAEGPAAPRRISLLSLAELLIRLWTDPRPPAPRPESEPNP